MILELKDDNFIVQKKWSITVQLRLPDTKIMPLVNTIPQEKSFYY